MLTLIFLLGSYLICSLYVLNILHLTSVVLWYVRLKVLYPFIIGFILPFLCIVLIVFFAPFIKIRTLEILELLESLSRSFVFCVVFLLS